MIYISQLDDSKYYLEGRGHRDEHPVLVALELEVGEDSILLAPVGGKLYSCVAQNESGLCTFETKDGIILACGCVDVDTTSTCDLSVWENVQLL